jgi:hypothetical protein
MEGREDESVVFETEGGGAMEFTVLHEFVYDGGMYAVLQKAGAPGETLIAEISDPLGPDEEFIPLPLKRQQVLLDYLKRGHNEED